MIDDDGAAAPATAEDIAAFAQGAGQEAPAPKDAAVPGEAPPPSRAELEAADIAAFKSGAEAATPKPAEPEPPKPDAEAVTPKAEAQPAEPPKPDKPPEDDETEKHIAEINAALKREGRAPLTEKSMGRMRHFAQQAKAAQEKIKPLEDQVASLRPQAERMAQWDDVVRESRASGEQIQRAMGYLQAINSGDPRMQNQALDAMIAEVQHWSKLLGREVPGVDPLSEHADLARAVEEGGLERATALRIANDRAMLARTGEHTQRLSQQQEIQQATQRARQDIDVLNDQLKAADPQFVQKLPFLVPTIQLIQQTQHPSQWAAAIRDAYLKIPALPQPAPAPAPKPAAAAPKPPVGAVPVRPTGNASAAMRPSIPDDPVAAFKLGHSAAAI